MGDPSAWLRNYADQVLLPMAEIAAANGVEMLSLFNDPGIQNRHRTLWIDIIGELRDTYSGDLLVADPRFPSIYRKNNEVLFADQLDLYGFQAYLPGSGYPEFPSIPGFPDPTIDHMRRNVAEHFAAREQEVISLGMTAVATEFGLVNYDGANTFPAKTFLEEGQQSTDNQEQVDYYEANLREFSSRGWMSGVFIWSVSLDELIVFHDGTHTNDFRGLPAEDLVRIWFRASQ